MSVQPTDVAVLLISLVACIYCMVLSRRLRTLQNTKDGLGATIVAFSKSMSAMSKTTRDTRSSAGELTERLSKAIAESKEGCATLEEVLRKVETKCDDLLLKSTTATDDFTLITTQSLDRAKSYIEVLEKLINDVRRLPHEVISPPPEGRAQPRSADNLEKISNHHDLF